MGKGLIFLCCSCAILLFTIINLSIGPIISGKVGDDPFNWGTANCKAAKDNYDEQKKGGCTGDCLKFGAEWTLNFCNNGKAMYNMEYTSFIFDIVIGFICGLLGLLHHFEPKKDFVSKTGLIGLGCGIIGFVLTFVYLILNGIVYTNYYNISQNIYKRDSDGAFAELKGDKYKCFYFDKAGNGHSIMAKFSDLNKKQYNYNKELIDLFTSQPSSTTQTDQVRCRGDPTDCIIEEYIDNDHSHQNNGKDCQYLYINLRSQPNYNQFINKDISDRFLTALILSLFVCFANLGLALFGFLLFRNPGEF